MNFRSPLFHIVVIGSLIMHQPNVSAAEPPMPSKQAFWAIAIHGGAGGDPEE